MQLCCPFAFTFLIAYSYEQNELLLGLLKFTKSCLAPKGDRKALPQAGRAVRFCLAAKFDRNGTARYTVYEKCSLFFRGAGRQTNYYASLRSGEAVRYEIRLFQPLYVLRAMSATVFLYAKPQFHKNNLLPQVIDIVAKGYFYVWQVRANGGRRK